MEIQFNWSYGDFTLDTDTSKMVDLPGRAVKFEKDAELCMLEGNGTSMNYKVADIHTGNLESANALCKEIAKRWNDYQEWHEAKDDTTDYPPFGTTCVLRATYKDDDGELIETYPTAVWGQYGWYEDFLDRMKHYEDFQITHWKIITPPARKEAQNG